MPSRCEGHPSKHGGGQHSGNGETIEEGDERSLVDEKVIRRQQADKGGDEEDGAEQWMSRIEDAGRTTRGQGPSRPRAAATPFRPGVAPATNPTVQRWDRLSECRKSKSGGRPRKSQTNATPINPAP